MAVGSPNGIRAIMVERRFHDRTGGMIWWVLLGASFPFLFFSTWGVAQLGGIYGMTWELAHAFPEDLFLVLVGSALLYVLLIGYTVILAIAYSTRASSRFSKVLHFLTTPAAGPGSQVIYAATFALLAHFSTLVVLIGMG